MNRRVLIVALLSAGLVAGAAGTGPVKTGKERLSDKASDEQRVNDCKVPPERRGASQRPTECGRRSQPAEPPPDRSEEHTSELQSLMRNPYAVLCWKRNQTPTSAPRQHTPTSMSHEPTH